MPNVDVWRPADGNETSAAYYAALTRTRTPSILCLSRQNLPNLEASTIEHALKGGYVVHEVEGEDLTFVSTGSEVSIVLEAAQKLPPGAPDIAYPKTRFGVRFLGVVIWLMSLAVPLVSRFTGSTKLGLFCRFHSRRRTS